MPRFTVNKTNIFHKNDAIYLWLVLYYYSKNTDMNPDQKDGVCKYNAVRDMLYAQ